MSPAIEPVWALGSITMNKASGGEGIAVELFHLAVEYYVSLILFFRIENTIL